jgi:exosortase
MNVNQLESSPPAEKAKGFDPSALLVVLKKPEALAVIAVIAAIVYAYFPLMAVMPSYWLDFDGYYAHGLLVIPAAAYIIHQKWDKIKDIPVKGGPVALVFLLPTLYVAVLGNRTVMPFLLSFLLLATIMFSIWFIAGWRWMWALSPGVLFVALGFPLLDRFIDTITFRLQLISTDTAEQMLKLVGFQVLRVQPTVLGMDNFDLNIAEACSGLKTTIAVTAIVLFFMLTTQLRWWAHAILAVIAIPLSILVNGFRIALIGVVGNSQGHEAGIAFHDWSGYIALGVCFFIIFQLSKFLEDRSAVKTLKEAAA